MADELADRLDGGFWHLGDVHRARWYVRFLDNIFVERLWRSLKYECIFFLYAWSGGREARAGIGKWIEFYNQQRPHSALGGRIPNAVYWIENDQEKPDWQTRSVA